MINLRNYYADERREEESGKQSDTGTDAQYHSHWNIFIFYGKTTPHDKQATIWKKPRNILLT